MKTLSNEALGVLYLARRDFFVSPNEVRELWTDVAPFTTIVSNMGMKTVPDPDFKLFEHRAGWVKQEFSLNDGAPAAWATNGDPGSTLAGDAAVAIDGVTGLVGDDSLAGRIVEIWDVNKTTYKGVALVTAYSSGVKLKALGNPQAANFRMVALADNDVLIVIGSAFGEGTSAPEAWSDELEVVYNSTEIFKTPIEITGTLYEAALRGYSSELERFRVEKNKEHKIQKERAFLFGVRPGGTGSVDLAGDNVTNVDSHSTVITDAAGKAVRATMGIVPAIYRYGVSSGEKQNIFTIDTATYNYASFVDDMEKAFQYLPNDGKLTALCGPTMLSYWSKVDASSGFVKKSGFSVQLDSMQRSSLGFNFRTLVTPHGLLELVYAPVFRGPYANKMLVIDPSDLYYVQYRASKFQANIKTDNAYDGVKDQYFSDEGLGITLIEKHSIWTLA